VRFTISNYTTTGGSNSYTMCNVTINLDSDNDGIPDWWMLRYFGHPTGQTNDNSLASDDANNDGVSNLQHYQSYYNPDPTVLPNLAILTGNNQIGSNDTFLPIPVTVLATYDDGTPWTNSLLTFAVTNGMALVATSASNTPSSSVSARTDTNGLASVWIYFPSASSNLLNSTILASVSAGLNFKAVIINEYVPLAHWRFDDTNTWLGEEAQLPLSTNNLAGIPSWSSNAVWISNSNPAMLSYRTTETNGNRNIHYQTGSVLFYFKPDWTGGDLGGLGPQNSARLIEAGSVDSTNGWWSLYLDFHAQQIFFSTATNGVEMDNFSQYISWTANEWYQIALVYSPTSSALFIDGQQVATGAGVIYCPDDSAQAAGFRIGSDAGGNNQAEGSFDELETFDGPLAGLPPPTETYWFGIPDYKADPNGTLAAWQLKYFGRIGLDPNGDYDGDGVTDRAEFQNSTDPNKISFSFSVPNYYVNTNIVTGHFTILGGVPSSMAVLVDNTNFATASWMPYTSNITVNLGSTQGSHDIWIGVRGAAANAYQTWEDATFILNSILPTISITNPIAGTTLNASRMDVSGTFSAVSLKQITVNDVLAFVNGTNFEALNVPLAAGSNAITAVIEALTGETNISTISIVGITNSDGSMNAPVQLSATPVAGFSPLSVTFSVQTSVPGTLEQVLYDFNGDDIADFITNNLNSIAYTYATNGEYFPVATVQTDAGRFSSVGGWNAVALDPSNQPVQINVQTPATQTVFASIPDPVDLKWDGTNLYVLSGSGAKITEFNTNGSVVCCLTNLGTNPSGFDVDGAGNVYVAVTASNQVWKFFPTNSSFQADTNFGIGGRIGLTNGSSGTTNGAFNAPFDVAVTPDGGTISVSDSGNNRIQQFDANGNFTVSFGSSGSDVGQFNMPKGLTYDSAGTLYIVDSGNNRIVLAQDFGVVSVTGTSGTALAQLGGPVNISIGERGVYVADTGNNRIQGFSPAAPHSLFSIDSSTIRFAVSTNFDAPAAVAAVAAVDSLTNELFYVADTANNRVVLCNGPAENSNTILAVWNSMMTHVGTGDIPGATSCFSVAASDKYRRAFLSVGTANTIAAISQIGELTPVYILDDRAEYYFRKTFGGQSITFPVEFDKEAGVWKILEF